MLKNKFSLLLFFIICILLSYSINYFNSIKVIIFLVAIVSLIFISFKQEFGMYLVILSYPFSYMAHFCEFKIGVYKIWLEEIFFLILFFATFAKIAIKRDKYQRPPFQNIILLFFSIGVINIFLAIFIYSLGFGSFVSKTIYFIKTYFEYILFYFLFFNVIKNKKQVITSIVLIIISYIISVIISLTGIIGVRGETIEKRFGAESLTGWCFSPNTFSITCLIIVAFIIFQILYKNKIIQRILLSIPIVFLFFFLVRSASRLGMLSLFVFFLTFYFLSNKKNISVFLIGLIIINLCFFTPSFTIYRIQRTVSMESPKINQYPIKIFGRTIYVDGSTAYRYHSMMLIPQIAILYLFIGTGYAVPLFPENNYLEIVLHFGLIGLVIFLYLFYSIFKNLMFYKKKLENNYLQPIILSMITTVIIVCFASMGARIIFSPRVSMLFWSLLAIVFKGIMLEFKEIEN